MTLDGMTKPERNLFANVPLPRQFRRTRRKHMAKSTSRQRRTEGRVMHEFKHGELKSGRGGKVKSRKQAIAIALSEAGASKYDSKRKQRHNRARSSRKEARGATGQQEREGTRHIGAQGKRESTRAEGGKNARHRTASGKRAARSRVRGGSTKAELYKKAQKQDIPNRSKMTKTQLENALKR
jgi:uncharacterized protein DUF6496